MCFARSQGTVSYFKPLNPEKKVAKLLLPSFACRVIDAPLVTVHVLKKQKGDFS